MLPVYNSIVQGGSVNSETVWLGRPYLCLCNSSVQHLHRNTQTFIQLKSAEKSGQGNLPKLKHTHPCTSPISPPVRRSVCISKVKTHSVMHQQDGIPQVPGRTKPFVPPLDWM